MLCIPQVNHQKLVKECYPANKALGQAGPEYRANSNELGRLCYYAQFKPAKLTKVGRLLSARAASDKLAWIAGGNQRNKAGLMVTLAIVRDLIEASPNGLTYLAPCVQAVVRDGLQAARSTKISTSYDQDLGARATSTFATYARALPMGAMEIDEAVPVCMYASLAEVQPMTSGDVTEVTRFHAISALQGVVCSNVLYSGCFSTLLHGLLPGLLDTVSPMHSPLQQTVMLVTQDGNVNVSESPQPTQDPSASTAAALVLLRHIANGADATQIRILIQLTLKWLDSTPNGSGWNQEDFCVWLLNTLTLWTPTTSRYVVPHTLLEGLSSTSSTPANPDRSTRLLQALHQILANRIEIQGLNMIELLDGHLRFLLMHVQHDPNDGTIAPTIDAIGYLAQHPMYDDQTIDFVQQINTHLRTIQEGKQALPPIQRVNSLRVLLYAQMAILRASYASQPQVSISLHIWRGTESLLLSPHPAVRFTYLETLLVHINLIEQHRSSAQPTEPRDERDMDLYRFLHGLIANAYIILAKPFYPSEAPLQELQRSDTLLNLSQISTVPNDYVTLLAVCTRLLEVFATPALLTTVPALLALDKVASTNSSQQAMHASTLARAVAGLALIKVAQLWEVPELASYVQTHILHPLGELRLEQSPAFGSKFGKPPTFALFDSQAITANSQSSDQSETSSIAQYLASSPVLQTATSCDAATLRTWLLRNWSVSVAWQDAQSGAFPTVASVRSPRRLRSMSTTTSPHVPPSLVRDASINVSQLKMALSSRTTTRSSVRTNLEDDNLNGDAQSLHGHRRRSRSRNGRLSTPPSVSALLDQFKLGDESLTNSSFHQAPRSAPAPSASTEDRWTSSRPTALPNESTLKAEPRFTAEANFNSQLPTSLAPPLPHAAEQLTGLAPPIVAPIDA
ncbi:plasma membrane localization protein [Malassezia yamatoensis]|uniref:Plasma membrane localization protein n=1 Tax=Malassezia yamatoensis TaxID=253288 RepID=A0AAJ5YUA5_9BASI|nr:plasma membrane localization protein [Malassezia yamatoensis]